MWITVGKKNLTCNGPLYIPTSDLMTYKVHWNSSISTPGSKYLVSNAKKLYIDNPMLKHEYYKIALSLIPK